MKTITMIALAMLLGAHSPFAKERLLVLTDIGNEPDDAQSLVRLLTYANHFDIEGLVATTSRHQRKVTAAWRISSLTHAFVSGVSAAPSVLVSCTGLSHWFGRRIQR